MIELLDYVLDYDDNFWIVEQIDNEVKGFKVYEVDENGNRYNNITKKNYSKAKFQKLEIIPAYKKIFKPNEFYLKVKKNLKGVWKKYIEVLNKIGIEDSDIGIYGSYLVGFDIIKDIDFVIYGDDNLYKYYDNNELIKEYTNSTYINKKHILYQYEKHRTYHHKDTDLLEIIKRNWSGIQVDENVLSTPRFIDRKKQHQTLETDNKKEIIFEVIDGFKTAMLPRRATVLYNGEEYNLETCIWKYQSFLRRGDVVKCYASINEGLKTILLEKEKSYVKFIKKGKEIK